jgi:hypothetical protein
LIFVLYPLINQEYQLVEQLVVVVDNQVEVEIQVEQVVVVELVVEEVEEVEVELVCPTLPSIALE